MAQEIGSLNTVGSIEANFTSSLALAYIGDSVYELIIRTYALEHHINVNDVNRCAKKYSMGTAQALIAKLLEEDMSEEELRIYKRGRNAKSISAPHTCTISEYRRATGLEALCGYLYLAGRNERAVELVRLGIEKYNGREKKK